MVDGFHENNTDADVTICCYGRGLIISTNRGDTLVL